MVVSVIVLICICVKDFGDDCVELWMLLIVVTVDMLMIVVDM
jgi:hypothetical protein